MPKVTINPLGPPFDFIGSGGGGSGTPSPPDTSVQFNDGGSFGGDANLTWNKTVGQIFASGPGSAGSIYAFSEAPDGANASIGAVVEGTSDGSLAVGLVGLIVRTFTGDAGGSIVPFQRSIQINAPSSDGGVADEITGLYVRDVTGGNVSSYAIKTGAGLVAFGDEVDMATGKGIKLSTTDPHVAGVLWNNSGLAMISSG